MTLNLNKYASFAEYYADTRPVGEHTVSYVGNAYVIYDDDEIHDMQGNKIDLEKYLNFYMPNGGTVSLNKTGSPTVVELEYSLDGCKTWADWQEVGNVRTLTLTAGQKMWLRNKSATQTGFSTGVNEYYNFTFAGSVEVSGNCNSLVCKFPSIVTTLSAYSYYAIFHNCTSLTLFDDFTLPATTLADYCYAHMFNGCTSLTLPYSFTLPATTLVYGCYYFIFYGCSLLNKIRTLMTDISAADCITNWLSHVADTGDFYCDQNLTIPTGASGIPSGWTRHDI